MKNLDNARVLLVEDNDADALLFKRHCGEIDDYEWTIEHVKDFDGARAAIAAGPHDLYFFDYRIGVNNGIELLHELHKVGHTAPVIMMTGLHDEQIGEKSLIAGATEFITKSELSPKEIGRIARYASIRRNAETQLRTHAHEDGLTGALNRGYFISLAEVELSRSLRFDLPLALLMLDIDHFKAVNDQHGHSVGDQIILAMVECCRANLRASDLIGRYGGDEFVILLPHTDAAGAQVLAERICAAMRNPGRDDQSPLPDSTLSVGVACLAPPAHGDINKLIEAADRALYAAKKQGRNRVILAE